SGLTLSGGNAGYYGAGGGLLNYGTATLTNCTVSGNSAGGGGGLLNYGTATLTNCTVSGNSAGFGGGGVYNAGTATLINCTVSGTSDEQLFTYFGTTAITNTIVAGEFSIFGAVSGSNNLIGSGGSVGLINGVNGNIVGVANPGLAPLGNYG